MKVTKWFEEKKKTFQDNVMEIWKYKRLEHQICLCVF